jgi:biopolymer transport protein TolR
MLPLSYFRNFLVRRSVKAGEVQNMSMSCGGGKGPRAEINMTPMIDVLLVLIIIFMVITPIAPTGLDTLIPQAPAPGQPPSSPGHEIVISVLADGSILLNRETLERGSLEGRLVDLYKQGGTPVFIRGDKQLEYRQIAEVIDIAKRAGVERVGLMAN